MEKHFKSEDCRIVEGKNVALEIKNALDILQKIIEDNWIELEYDRFERKWGEMKFIPAEKGSKGIVYNITRKNVHTEEEAKEDGIYRG